MKDEIRLEDLPEQFRQIAEIVGLETAVALIHAAPGCTIYVPTVGQATAGARNREIFRKYVNGWTPSQLAMSYDMSESYIRSILAEQKAATYKQTSLEDFLTD